MRSLVLAALVSLSGSAIADMPEFDYSTGTALIAAPTSETASANGVWFVNPETGMFSLQLPELPDGYVYEGWIVNSRNGGKLSTGKFRANGSVDSDAAGALAGNLSLNFPPVPGSDFVKTRIDLADGIHKVVITVEPYPDNSRAPTSVVALVGLIPYGTAMGSSINLSRPN